MAKSTPACTPNSGRRYRIANAFGGISREFGFLRRFLRLADPFLGTGVVRSARRFAPLALALGTVVMTLGYSMTADVTTASNQTEVIDVGAR